MKLTFFVYKNILFIEEKSLCSRMDGGMIVRERWKKEIILFVIGAVWGFIYWGNTVWNTDVRNLLHDIKHIKLPLNWHWIFETGVHLGIATLVLAVITMLLLWILRFFSDSRNTHVLIVAGQWFTDLVLCSFLTGVILFYFNKWFLDKIIGSRGEVVFSITYLFVYILVYMILCSWFDISIERVQRKPKKNCCLLICQVQNRETFIDVKQIVRKCKYTECYNLMRNNHERLSPKQFWVIREKNFTGKKMTAEWRYYANGDYIELDDGELATRLLLAENAKNIDWQL